MAHTRKQKGTRSTAPSSRIPKRASSYNGKPARARNRYQTTGTTAAPLLGIGIAVTLFLALALIVIIGQGRNIANASGGGTPGSSPLARHVCGTAGELACPPDDLDWVLITSESPDIVAAAITRSEHFTMMKDRYNYAALDTPALVHAYGPHTGIQYYDDDHWVVSVRNASSLEVGIFDFVYDRANHRLRFSSFGALGLNNPHSHQAFPYIPASMAVTQLQSQHNLAVLPGKQPELIFFPIDPHWRDLSSPAHSWKGGGEAPTDPMWHLVSSDGHDYFVGGDLYAYTLDNLPFAPGGQP